MFVSLNLTLGLFVEQNIASRISGYRRSCAQASLDGASKGSRMVPRMGMEWNDGTGGFARHPPGHGSNKWGKNKLDEKETNEVSDGTLNLILVPIGKWPWEIFWVII